MPERMRGRPIRGLFGGLILGILLSIDLVFSGIVKLSSTLVTLLPLVLLVIGLLLGLWAPVGRNPKRVSPPNFAAPVAREPAPAQPAPPIPPPAEDTPPV
jgi:hypothetical protein